MSKFFIDRPIFAWVIALIVMIAGGLSILKLPVNQYPDIAPPAISIQVTYPGASAQTVQDTVVQVIEQQLNGIDSLRYVSSESNSDGTMTITVTFNQGTNPDIAQVQVQNKLNLATPLLPQEVQQQGIRVTKAVKNFLMVIGLVSADGSMSRDDLANYIVSNMQDPISRTPGVGDFQVFGAQYAMRIWLDPAKLNKFQLTPMDVQSAIAAQNVQVSSGQLGGLPAVAGQQLNATIIGKTRLQSAEQFQKILLKVNADGSQVRLADVAEVALGGENYSISAQFNGKPASGLAVKLATGANALDTAKALRQTISDLEPFFPPGVQVVFPYDTTPVVSASITGVIHTLIEAVALVVLVVIVFLQTWRAAIIPIVAIPVALVGSFMGVLAFGFTLNELDTARRHGLPVITIVHNNAAWGVIRMGQKAGMNFEMGTALEDTDYAAIARGFGCHGEVVTRAGDVAAALQRAIASGLPAVLDCRTKFLPHPAVGQFVSMNKYGFASLTRSA